MMVREIERPTPIPCGLVVTNGRNSCSATSSASPGLFADAYWNFGWIGVVVCMSVVGVVEAFLSRYTLDVVRREAWLYFPVVLMGMQIGFRTDGFFVIDIVGGTVILVCVHFVLKFIDRFVLPLLRQPAIAPV